MHESVFTLSTANLVCSGVRVGGMARMNQCLLFQLQIWYTAVYGVLQWKPQVGEEEGRRSSLILVQVYFFLLWVAFIVPCRTNTKSKHQCKSQTERHS